MTLVTFQVDGVPTPQGSTRGWLNPKTGRVQITHSNPAPLRSWRQDIAARARDAGVEILQGGVAVTCSFRLQRPKSASPKRQPLPSVRPDLDKYVRCVLDALTGIAFKDDGQVVYVLAQKVYADEPGMTCTVEPAIPGATSAEQLPLEVPA